jgi:hypothetical protein
MKFVSLLNSKGLYKCCTKTEFAHIRNTLREYGVDQFQKEMMIAGVFNNDKISNEPSNNPFAKILSGKMENPCKDKLNNTKYVLFQNKTENDEHWENSNDEWLGKASMSKKHKMLCPVYDHWSNFNVLTLGMSEEFGLKKAIEELNDMEMISIDYTKERGWSNNVGLYFHCYPFNSIMTMHLHILDLNTVGPSFKKLEYKNLKLDDVRKVLNEDLLYCL